MLLLIYLKVRIAVGSTEFLNCRASLVLQEMKQRFHFCTENKSLLIFLCRSFPFLQLGGGGASKIL